jgi:UDP-2,3-diacylglucosamine pyrophosphatase LpxH
MSIKRVFVSDVHMSPGWSLESQQGCYDWFSKAQAQQFRNFLEKMVDDKTIHEVILLGDLFDGWVYPIETQPPKYDETANAPHIVPIIANLQKLAEEKKVIYVIGNHDMSLAEAQFESFRKTVLAGITFQDFYETSDGLYAEHGHQYTMYNAVDPKHELPIGHYISRLAANVAKKKNHFHINADFDVRFPSTGGLTAHPLVHAPLSLLEEELGNVDDNTPITTVNGGVITLAEVKQQYAKLGIDWINKHGLLDGLHSAWREAVGLDSVADRIARGKVNQDKSYKVVIFGHTHKEKNLLKATGAPEPEKHPYAIYANCGAWCQNNEPTYVLDEYDEAGKHTITLTYWDQANKKIVNTI